MPEKRRNFSEFLHKCFQCTLLSCAVLVVVLTVSVIAIAITFTVFDAVIIDPGGIASENDHLYERLVASNASGRDGGIKAIRDSEEADATCLWFAAGIMMMLISMAIVKGCLKEQNDEIARLRRELNRCNSPRASNRIPSIDDLQNVVPRDVRILIRVRGRPPSYTDAVVVDTGVPPPVYAGDANLTPIEGLLPIYPGRPGSASHLPVEELHRPRNDLGRQGRQSLRRSF